MSWTFPFPKWQKTPLPDLSELPVTITRVVAPKHAKEALLVAAGLIIAPLFLLPLIGFEVVLLYLIAALVVVLLSIYAAFRFFVPTSREIITIARDTVTVERSGEFGEERWWVPVSEFKSVCWRTRFVGTLKIRPAHFVELLHADSSNDIVLYSGYLPHVVRSLCSQVAHTLDLPQTSSEEHSEGINRDMYHLYLRTDDSANGNMSGNENGKGGEGERRPD
jgi:hypothetical protein